MLFNRDEFRIEETYNIRLRDEVLQKLEDGLKRKEPLLVTVDASHYGMMNGNFVIYRHDTVRHNIGTFIHPEPKPIITNHRPKQSKRFGRVIAVDYKPTQYEAQFSKIRDFEGMSTLDYLNLCRDELIPYQMKHPEYNGLGYCEIVGKIEDEEGIKKVLSKEFLSVSIGADPKRLICSHCLKDQVVGICDHYGDRDNGIFMLAEELEYEELSFLVGKKPADPFGKVRRIHDGKVEETYYDFNMSDVHANIDIINARDFFKLADETKTIVCVDNICKIVNQEDNMAKKSTEQKPTFNVSYAEEFAADQIKALKLTDNEEDDTVELLTLTDEVVGNLKNSDFAIVQKTEEGTKRRFPIHDAVSVKAAAELLGEAKDLSPAETLRAKASIEKAAKKLGVDVEVKTEGVEKIADAEIETVSDIAPEVQKTLESIVEELRTAITNIEASKLTDAETEKPISFVISSLVALCDSVEWAKEDLDAAVNKLLDANGLVTISKEKLESVETAETAITTLQDELTEAKEEIALLDELNTELNVQIRKSMVDEILDSKQVLGTLLQDAVEAERAKLVKYPYEVLVDQVSDLRVLKVKLSDKVEDKVVNNKQVEEITTVIDPTLADSAPEDEIEVVVPKTTENRPSRDEMVQAFRDLFRI